MDALLDIRDLNVDFATSRGRVKALRSVDLSAKRGRILGIVGESGSGKSTVLWSILGRTLDGGGWKCVDRRIYDFRDMLPASLEGNLASGSRQQK